MRETTRSPGLLEALPFWSFLSEGEREKVLNRQSVLSYPAGAHVRDGDRNCLGLLLIRKGTLRAYLLSPEGREMTLYRIREGESCITAAACVLDAISFETHVEAEEDSEVVLIPVDVFSSLVRNNIHVECYSYKMATERFSDVVAGVERLVFLNLEQRIASYLLDEASSTHDAVIHKTHEQIAVNIGSAREVVSRALKGMAQQGFVELFRGGVRLVDKPALYQMIS